MFLEYNCSLKDNLVKRLRQVMDVNTIEVTYYYY